MNFYFTQKMIKKLKLGPLPELEPDPDPYLNWYANLFRVGGNHFILITNPTSLFSVIWPGRGITNLKAFERLFDEIMENYLTARGMESIYRHMSRPEAGPVRTSKTLSRSVLGSMNDLVYMSQVYSTETPEKSPGEILDSLNTTPFSALEYASPKQVFPDMGPH